MTQVEFKEDASSVKSSWTEKDIEAVSDVGVRVLRSKLVAKKLLRYLLLFNSSYKFRLIKWLS
ncbi:MAG: hypothetical protein K0S63_430 [Gammaproteobacteria bacterium]|jgi:hypothetical protein|nr:hypothetical protein [Gammaproteobacteria bacterium]